MSVLNDVCSLLVVSNRVALEILIINVIVVVFKHFHVPENKSAISIGCFIFIYNAEQLFWLVDIGVAISIIHL